VVIADEISISASELNFWNIWMNSSLSKYDEDTFWNLYHMHEELLTASETIYLDAETSSTVLNEYVEKYKESLISCLLQQYFDGEEYSGYGSNIYINQREKHLKWEEFTIHKESNTEYIGKSKDGLSFRISFDIDEDVELDSQIEEFIELDLLNSFECITDGHYRRSEQDFTSLPKEEKLLRIASFLLLGCYLGYLDDLDDDYAVELFEFMDRFFEDEDWKRGVSIARDGGCWSGYGMQDDEPDYPLHSMFDR